MLGVNKKALFRELFFVEEGIEISNILADLQEIEIIMKMLNGNLDSE